MSLTFGTDGVRGDAERDLTTALVVAFGAAAAEVLGPHPPFAIGRDTRESGPRIVSDLRAGLALGGAAVRDLGVVPTPVVAFASELARAPGAMVSASHNRFSDNGIKLFAPGGQKLDGGVESAIEAELARRLASTPPTPPPPPAPPPPVPSDAGGGLDGVIDSYRAHVASALGGRRLDGLRLVVDCANGAAFELGPLVLRDLGAQVVAIHASPDGRNINEACGSTHPDDLRRAVVAAEADAGLAFDGDADRVIAVDERGAVVDGDQMLVIAARDLHARGALRNGGIAVTVMSNLGLRQALTAAGITVVTTPVGDRAVLQALTDHGLALGGEQSGHIVFAEHATTGDGILTGALLLDVVRRSGARLSELASQMVRYPQVLENVLVAKGVDLDHADELWDAVGAEQAALGDDGRVLVRASGTEPVVRVMVEARTRAAAEATARRLVAVVRRCFGGPDGPKGRGGGGEAPGSAP